MSMQNTAKVVDSIKTTHTSLSTPQAKVKSHNQSRVCLHAFSALKLKVLLFLPIISWKLNDLPSLSRRRRPNLKVCLPTVVYNALWGGRKQHLVCREKSSQKGKVGPTTLEHGSHLVAGDCFLWFIHSWIWIKKNDIPYLHFMWDHCLWTHA